MVERSQNRPAYLCKALDAVDRDAYSNLILTFADFEINIHELTICVFGMILE